MIAEKVYLLDANVFIQAKNQYYTFQICPGFWESLIQENAEKTVGHLRKLPICLVSGKMLV